MLYEVLAWVSLYFTTPSIPLWPPRIQSSTKSHICIFSFTLSQQTGAPARDPKLGIGANLYVFDKNVPVEERGANQETGEIDMQKALRISFEKIIHPSESGKIEAIKGTFRDEVLEAIQSA